MTKTIAAIAALLLAGAAEAAGVLTYSGYLQDAQGKAVTATTTISFRFYAASTGGAPIWEDLVTVLPNQDGWFSAVIGGTTSNPLEAADFNQPLWLALKITTDAAEMLPRMRIGTAPYALTVDWSGVLAKPTVFPTDWASVSGKPTSYPVAWEDITAKPTTFPPGPVDWATVTGKPTTFPSDWPNVTNKPLVYPTDWASVAGKPTTYPADPAVFQQRVTATCAAGSSIRVVNQDGSVVCEPDNATTYFAGSGLGLSGSTFVTDNTVVARKDAAAGNQSFDSGTMYLDYANNRVGVFNAAPTTALDVNGTATVNDLAYRTAKTSAFTVTGVNFTPDQGAVTVEYISSGYLYFTGATTVSQLYAPVHVPEGARLGTFACWYYDNDATNNVTLTIYLFTKALTDLGATVLGSASFTSSGAGTTVQSLTAPALSHTVNSDNAYYMLVGMGAAASSNHRFYGCRVTYTMNAPGY